MKQRQADVSVCTAHMTWSNPIPTCEKRRCPANETSIKEVRNNDIDRTCHRVMITSYLKSPFQALLVNLTFIHTE